MTLRTKLASLPSRRGLALVAVSMLACGSSPQGAKGAQDVDEEDAPMCTEGREPPAGVERFHEEDMTRPRLIHHRPPSMASDHDPRVTGQQPGSTFKCVITREGRVENCCIVKEASHAVSKSFLWVMPDWRYEPAKENGRPVSVEYVINVGIHTGPLLGKTVRAQPPGGR